MDDIPKTSSGKPCKLCTSKGGVCHVHAHTRASASPKRSSDESPISPFEFLKGMPNPALYEILLKLDMEQLHYICSTNRKAHKICASPRFKKAYKSKLFVGKFQSSGPYEFTDHAGNIFQLTTDGKTIKSMYYENRAHLARNAFDMIMLRFVSGYAILQKINVPSTEEALALIGKPYWKTKQLTKTTPSDTIVLKKGPMTRLVRRDAEEAIRELFSAVMDVKQDRKHLPTIRESNLDLEGFIAKLHN